MACSRISLQLWMVIVFTTIGLILHVISFAAPHWNDFGDEHWGLWQICDKRECEYIESHHGLSDTMQVGRGCQVLGLFCFIVVAVLVVLHLVYKHTSQKITWDCNLRILTTAVIFAFLSLFSILIGAILWSTGSNTTLSWCYYLGYFSGLAASTSGGVLIFVRRQELMYNIEKTQAISTWTA